MWNPNGACNVKLLVCGGRDFSDYALVKSTLDVFGGSRGVTLAHGGARGADLLAGRYAASRGWPVRVFPADWQAHGKSAGPRRNQQMLTEFVPDLVIAFPGGRGTSDMIARARRAGVPVREVSAPEQQQ